MGQLKRDCPHCHTKNTAFHAYGEVPKTGTRIYTTALYCAGCFGGLIVEIGVNAGDTPVRYNGNIDANPNLVILDTYPEPTQPKAPKHLPANIEKFFLQAANNLQTAQYDAAAIMSRKALEVAVKTLAPDLSGSLYDRIEKLAGKNLLTPDLKDWAHIIRDDGNVAAHEEEPVTPEFAREILSFAEMFLMYTFTMPKMVEERRQNKNST